MTGLPFVVKKSDAPEIQKIRTTCAQLVKDNALIKARDIASQLKQGVVIGADTVVLIDKKELVLKPKDLKEARRKLKKLMASPQWVYTGVAVIDIENNLEIVEHEKTKVFMNTLSDDEIDRYHQRVPPLDKAGGFDIEGLGNLFIPRIEGCYTNVIGLPMSRLRMMLKKVGVSVLSIMLMISVSACTSEYNVATNQQEYYIYSSEKEVKLGSKVAASINKSYELYEGVEENQRVENILDRIVAVCDRQDIVYFVEIIDREDINALALPGGYIYLFKGILDHAENDDQIAGVIAHEVAHITAKHGLKRLQASYGALLLQIAAVEARGNVAGGIDFALASLFTAYSQQDEFQADELGLKYMERAGYDPNEMIKFLEILKKENDKRPLQRYSYWRTHPHLPERIANANQLIKGQMDFRDYIRLIDRHDD